MEVIGISGSPRRQGNTHLLLEVTLQAAQEEGVEAAEISLAGLTIHPCDDCGVCSQVEDCPQDDDLWPIYDRLKASQGVIVASPVYFASVPPTLKALMDRAGFIARNNGHKFLGKVGGPIAVGNRAGHLFTLAHLLLWFNYCGFTVPGSPYWATASGREPGEVLQDEEGFRRARAFGQSVAHLMKRLRT
jgi:multimeric flavodoxin WrbA